MTIHNPGSCSSGVPDTDTICETQARKPFSAQPEESEWPGESDNNFGETRFGCCFCAAVRTLVFPTTLELRG